MHKDSKNAQRLLQQDNLQGWLQQDNLMYLGLIAIGLILVQPFLTVASLDIPATICVVAFSLAIPLLAFLVMINRLQSLHNYTKTSVVADVSKGIAILAASVGVVAAFWHLVWIAGVVVLVGGIAGLTAYTIFTSALTRDLGNQAPDAQAGGEASPDHSRVRVGRLTSGWPGLCYLWFD